MVLRPLVLVDTLAYKPETTKTQYQQTLLTDLNIFLTAAVVRSCLKPKEFIYMYMVIKPFILIHRLCTFDQGLNTLNQMLINTGAQRVKKLPHKSATV